MKGRITDRLFSLDRRTALSRNERASRFESAARIGFQRLVDGARSAVVFQRRAGRGNRQRDVLAAPLTQKVRGRQWVCACGGEEKSNPRQRARAVGHEGAV